MQTKREYLVSKGLAKPGRGKFSAAGVAEIEKAIASGMKFSDMDVKPKTKTVNSVSAKAPKEKVSKNSISIPAASFNPSDVRKWAKDKGIAVAARGRIHSDVVSQYLSEVPDAPERVTASPGNDFRAEAERIRMHEWYSAEDSDGGRIVKSYRDCCNSCGYSIGWCYCPNGPVAFNSDFELVSLSAGK